MAKLAISIKWKDGTAQEVRITPAAEVAFEDWAGVGLHIALSPEHGKNKNVYRLAWESLKAAGTVVKPFEDFLKEIDDADLVTTTANPT